MDNDGGQTESGRPAAGVKEALDREEELAKQNRFPSDALCEARVNSRTRFGSVTTMKGRGHGRPLDKDAVPGSRRDP